MEKITFNGEPVQIRNPKGEYSKKPKHSWAKYTMYAIGILLFGAVGAHMWVSKELVATKIVPVVHADVTPEITTEAKVQQLKQMLINDMASCEYLGYDQNTAIPKWDDNNAGTLPLKDKLSYGQMQWKISTMQRMYKTLHGTDLSNYEAILKAMDAKQAREIALDAWINIKGSINEWSCATEAMKTRVEDIRFLTK